MHYSSDQNAPVTAVLLKAWGFWPHFQPSPIKKNDRVTPPEQKPRLGYRAGIKGSGQRF